jgi:outer membrane receptor protein involved in Fe transport
MKNLITKLFCFTLLILFASTSYAQSGVGKLSGRVVDANTKEPLIGANILIMDTQLGAATDINGEYFILNITPGTYTVRFSYVGYAPKTVENVRMVANITYELNMELSTDFTLDDIVVIDRKLFEEKATNTVRVIDADQISRLPVRGVSNIASLQSGVVMQEASGGQSGNATLNVRGGRGSEVLYIIDGVPQNNLFNRSSAAQVSNVAIDQISFQVGGYEAKYGQAQSGIISVTTKSGQPTYNILADLITSSFTDNYGYNLYSGTISGPIIPGIPEHTIFLSGERQWSLDDTPPAIPYNYPSVGRTFDYTPNNTSEAWRLSAKTTHRMGQFSMNLSGLYNSRDYTLLSASGAPATQRFIKNNSSFADGFAVENTSLNARISQTLSANTYWNLNLGYRVYDFERFNPYFGNDLLAYGDSARWANELGVHLWRNGGRTARVDENNNPMYGPGGGPIAADTDRFGVFRPHGWATGLYQRRENDAINLDFDITSQIGNHLVEFGLGASRTVVRGFGVFALQLADKNYAHLSTQEKFEALEPFVYGYDVTGQNRIGSDFENKLQRPYEPIIGYAYLQDRFELEDLVLNLGLRMDYIDLKSYVLVNPALPFAGGTDPFDFDDGDFRLRDVDIEFSPRIGIGYPVTESTVFHAQYGRFIQIPELNDVYFGPYDYNVYLPGGIDPQSGFNGALLPEETVQYEAGFRQLLAGGQAALNITAFYKNIRGLVNVESHKWRELEGGRERTAIYPENSDFGTTKGLALSLDVSRMHMFNVSAQYTFQIAEGTGSSTSSNQTAVFRNTDNLPPKVIAPLNFDQRHTAIVNVDFFVPKGELGWLELFNVNALFSFNSGRPYTPVSRWNLLGDNSLIAENMGYVNSAFAPGSFRIDLKMEKGFSVGNSMFFTPYLWIENLLDSDNIVNVYRSTGDPYTTGWLTTEQGQSAILFNGLQWAQDYESLERSPRNFGIPRLIRLGLKINFANISL